MTEVLSGSLADQPLLMTLPPQTGFFMSRQAPGATFYIALEHLYVRTHSQ